MIYIKEDENTDDNMVGYPNLIPGQMYMEDGTICCYIGNNNMSKYNLVFLLFHYDKTIDNYFFIEWVNWLKFTPLNIDIKDYIIKNNVVLKTIESIKMHEFSGKENGNSLNLIKNIYNSLLDDIDISMFININKFNI